MYTTPARDFKHSIASFFKNLETKLFFLELAGVVW